MISNAVSKGHEKKSEHNVFWLVFFCCCSNRDEHAVPAINTAHQRALQKKKTAHTRQQHLKKKNNSEKNTVDNKAKQIQTLYTNACARSSCPYNLTQNGQLNRHIELNEVPMHMHPANSFDNISDHLSGMFTHSMNNWFSAFLISCTQTNVNEPKKKRKHSTRKRSWTIVAVVVVLFFFCSACSPTTMNILTFNRPYCVLIAAIRVDCSLWNFMSRVNSNAFSSTMYAHFPRLFVAHTRSDCIIHSHLFHFISSPIWAIWRFNMLILPLTT